AFGSAAPAGDGEAKPVAFAIRDHSDGKFWMVDLDEQHASRQAELNDDTLVPLYDHAATPAGGGGELLAIADEMTRRMAGPPLRKPVYGAELIEWAERIRRLA